MQQQEKLLYQLSYVKIKAYHNCGIAKQETEVMRKKVNKNLTTLIFSHETT